MPARPRKETIRRDEVGYYHCFNRCVRRAFLCGVDPLTGNDYGHRKTWIQQRLETLAACFAIEVCGFSAMDNHLHLILRNRPDLVATWSDDEVARRWWQLCPQRRTRQGEPDAPRDIELKIWRNDPGKMRQLRDRLSDIQLLDWTGRQLRSGKPGAIPADWPAILERLKIDASRWPTLVSEFSRLFRSAAGRLESLVREAQRTGRHWLHGVRQAANAFG